MIYRLFSDLETFKNIRFHAGMNIIVAERSPDSTHQHTRNKTGKTSIVELINFILGSNCDSNCILRNDELKNYFFNLEFDLKDFKTIARRSGEIPNQIIMIDPEKKGQCLLIDDNNGKEKTSTVTEWRDKLGYYFFNLPSRTKSRKGDRFQPTFRSLFSYFARRENEGGIVTHERQSRDQQTWDQQVAISFLLGLDWRISQEFQQIREKEATLKKIKKAAGEGVFGEIVGKASHLRTSLAISEEKVARLEKDLKSFKVLPEYENYEIEASQLTEKLADIANENTLDYELINDLNISLNSEIPPSYDNLERIYEESRVIFSNKISRRFGDLIEFHDAVIKNRKTYLLAEVDEAQNRINKRETAKVSYIERRAEVMSILNSHGALDQFTKIHSDLIKLQAETESLRIKYEAAEQLEKKRTELDIERNKLLIRLRQNFQEQNQLMKHIILTFESISRRLYEDPGMLEITESTDGPKFEIIIQGERSKGIRNMQIFCFDMMIMTLCQERGIGPGFLIHDSHVFDGVDANQKATAFQIGAELAKKHNFQYIVTMNSCDMPMKFGNNFNINEFIVSVGITDAKKDGGVFGFNFR